MHELAFFAENIPIMQPRQTKNKYRNLFKYSPKNTHKQAFFYVKKNRRPKLHNHIARLAYETSHIKKYLQSDQQVHLHI